MIQIRSNYNGKNTGLFRNKKEIRGKEYLFSYAMNDDITQEIMARCKNVKEILELD